MDCDKGVNDFLGRSNLRTTFHRIAGHYHAYAINHYYFQRMIRINRKNIRLIRAQLT